MPIPKSHPRYASLKTRDKIVEGVEKGITSIHGLIAHGRGEAFDYLLGEKTNNFTISAINSASAMLLLAKHPVISVNGNTTILVPNEIVELSKILPAKIEVNVFHPSIEREKKIKAHLIKYGAKEFLLPQRNPKSKIQNPKFVIPYIEHNRRFVNKEGIYKADVVFVPLEDGDRTSALIKNDKKVITVDLNPLSRTAQSATVTIVDNIVRVMPLLIKVINEFRRRKNENELEDIIKKYNNKEILAKSFGYINQRLRGLQQ